VLLRLVIDIKEIVAAYRMKQAVGRYVTRQYQPTTTILIDLRRRADTIIPLLNNLATQRHKRLDVLIIMKHTAGKNARPTLEQYQAAHPELHLMIMPHQKGTSMIQYAHGTATTDVVMQMTDKQLLSDNFLTLAALPFIDHRISVVQPRSHIVTGNSLASACHAVMATWQHFFRLVRVAGQPLNTLQPGFIYRRSDLLASFSTSPLYRPQLAIRTAATTSWRDLMSTTAPRHLAARVTLVTINIVMVALLATSALFAIHKEQSGFLFGFLIGCYVVHYGLIQLSLRGYSIRENINIIFFAPFSLLALPLASVWPHRNTRP
jgi:hypothetical protein